MLFAKVENGTVVDYPYTLRAFKQDNPNVSPPNDLSALGAYGVVVVEAVSRPLPSDPITVKVVEATPTNVNGTWKQTWIEQPLTAEQIAQNQKAEAQLQVENDARADAFIQQFVQYNAQQVQNYVDANVTDLASAKAVLKKLALICLALAKTQLS